MAEQKNTNNMLADAKVRIITKSDIRYEGKLYQINATEKTVALKDVKSFGSEDRVKDKFVPPSDVIYEYIVFRSVEIKDLVVLKDETPEKKENANENANKVQEQVQTEKSEPKPERKQSYKEKEVPSKINNENQKDHKKTDYEEKDYKKHDYEERDYKNDRHAHNDRKPQRNQPRSNFEFDQMIQKLDVIEKTKDENDLECKKYIENDFFDDLSTSINKTDKRRDDPYQNRRVAKETFGYVPHQNYNRGTQGQGNNRYNRDHRDNRDYRDNRDNRDTNYNRDIRNNKDTRDNKDNRDVKNTRNNMYRNDYKTHDDGYRGGTYKRRDNNRNFAKKQDYEYVRKED